MRLSLTSCTTLDGERAATVGLAMFVRLRRRGRGLHENFLGCGLFGGVCSFLRGEGDHMSRAAVLRAHGAALGVHGDSFPPAGCCLVAGFEGKGSNPNARARRADARPP